MPKKTVTPLTDEQRRLVVEFRDQWAIVWAIRKRLPRFYDSLSIVMDDDDIEQIAILGVMRAAQKFDASRGLKFSTYAFHWIRAALSHEIDGRRRKRRAEPPIFPLDHKTTAELAKDEPGFARIDAAEEYALAVAMVGELNPIERTVVFLRYGMNGGEPLTQKQTGAAIGYSQPGAQDVERRALRRLRRIAERRR